MLAGATLGCVAGALLHPSLISIVAGGLLGATLGTLVAWPLHKLLVFFSAGLPCALLGGGALAATGAAPPVSLACAGLLLIGGGTAAVYFYQHVIVVVMAAFGVMVLQVVRVGFGFWLVSSGWREILAFITDRYGAELHSHIMEMVLLLGFALWFQTRENQDNAGQSLEIRGLRSMSYLLAGLAALDCAVFVIPLGDGFLRPILLTNLRTSWPLVAFVSHYLSRWAMGHDAVMKWFRSPLLARFAWSIFIVLVVFPVIAILHGCACGRSVPLWHYWARFGYGTALSIVLGGIWLLVALPAALCHVVLRTAVSDPQPGRESDFPMGPLHG